MTPLPHHSPVARAGPKVRRAFTLIELLTSIAIISILIAILLPALSGARRSGRRTKCQANVRELTAATLRYTGENGDVFPVAAECDDAGDNCTFWNGHQYFGWNGTRLSPSGKVWARPVNKELGLDPSPVDGDSAKIASCPSDAGAVGETGTNAQLFSVLGTSYAVNPILCQGRFSFWRYRDKDLNTSDVIQPSRQLLVFDHIAFGLTYDAAWTAIRPGWHDQTRPAAVVGFIDGHADYVTGTCAIREWQWYPDASGPDFTQSLGMKVNWTVLPGCE